MRHQIILLNKIRGYRYCIVENVSQGQGVLQFKK